MAVAWLGVLRRQRRDRTAGQSGAIGRKGQRRGFRADALSMLHATQMARDGRAESIVRCPRPPWGVRGVARSRKGAVARREGRPGRCTGGSAGGHAGPAPAPFGQAGERGPVRTESYNLYARPRGECLSISAGIASTPPAPPGRHNATTPTRARAHARVFRGAAKPSDDRGHGLAFWRRVRHRAWPLTAERNSRRGEAAAVQVGRHRAAHFTTSPALAPAYTCGYPAA